MNVIIGMLLTLLLIFLFLYPVVQVIDHLLFPHNMEHRIEEYRMLAAKLALNEYMMIRIINEERKQLGMPPIPDKAIIERFNDIGPWALLKAKCAALVNDALKNVTSIRLKV